MTRQQIIAAAVTPAVQALLDDGSLVRVELIFPDGAAHVANPTPKPPPIAVVRAMLLAPGERTGADLRDGDAITVDVNKPPTIVLVTEPAKVGSVVISDNGAIRSENSARYTLHDESKPWRPKAGEHRIIATPYTLADGQGEAGKPLNLTIRVSLVGGATPGEEPPKPEPEKLHAKATDKVLAEIRTSGYRRGPVLLTSDRPSGGTAVGATAFDIGAADCELRGVTIGSSNFRYVFITRSATDGLRVIGLTALPGVKIEGDVWYDDGRGQAKNIYIDMDGGTLYGSTEESGFRPHAKKITICNGTLLYYDKGDKGVKAAITIQDDSEDVLIENMTIEGSIFCGPIIEVGEKWQTGTVRRVTYRNVRSARGRQLRFSSGTYDITLEDVKWHCVDTISVIQGHTKNPHFGGEKPTVTLKGRCEFSGGTGLTNGQVHLVIAPGAIVTYNGKPWANEGEMP